jgi:hypothetical protein
MRDEEEGLGCDGGASGITGVEIDELGDTNPCSGTVAGVVAVTGAAGLPASLSFTSVSTWSSIHTTGSKFIKLFENASTQMVAQVSPLTFAHC